MNGFDNYCNLAERNLKIANNKPTNDVAGSAINTGLVYAVLALAEAVRNSGSSKQDLEGDVTKLIAIANRALDDKNRLLDKKIKRADK